MRWFWYVCAMLSIGVSASGCSGLASLADSMNARQIQSCIRWQGIIGGGWPGVPQIQAQGVTATGGMDLMQCVGK